MPYLNAMLNHLRQLFILLMLAISYSTLAADQNDQLLSSIRPLDLIVNDLVKNTTRHSTLLNAQQSPHHLQLKPSQRNRLQQASAIFWFGPELEPMMATILLGDKTLNNRAVNLQPKIRENSHEHDHSHSNPHYWLDRHNVTEVSSNISAVITDLYPTLKDELKLSLNALHIALDTLEKKLEPELEKSRSKSYLDLHNAWELLAEDLQLKKFYSIEHQSLEFVGAKSILKLKRDIDSGRYDCIIASPETNLRLVENLISNSSLTRTLVIDPLANDLPADAGFVDFLTRNIRKIADC